MCKKFLIFLSIISLCVANDSILECSLHGGINSCTCSLAIYNPNGRDNFTIRANPGAPCALADVTSVLVSGWTTNIPSIFCKQFPLLDMLFMSSARLSSIDTTSLSSCKNLKGLELVGNSISEIKAFTFSNTKLEFFDISFNNLRTWDPMALNGLSTMKMLSLNNNPGIYLPLTAFDTLSNLQTLRMGSLQLREIKPDWFKNLGNLRELDLGNNLISSVPAGAFYGLSNLNTLTLGSNSISELPENVFQYNPNLLFLFLNNNNIVSPSSKLFLNQGIINRLRLDNNPLTQISSDFFKPLTNVVSLNLSNCKLSKIDSEWFSTMSKLGFLFLDNNDISEIPENAFKSNDLVVFSIVNNKLTRMDSKSFGSVNGLTDILIRDNQVNAIDERLFDQLENLSILNISNNQCADFSTNNFNGNRTYHMELLRTCFDSFARNE